MKKLVIAFFHMGVSPYQWFNLDLAVKRNPDSEVILITDAPNEKYPDGVTIVDMGQYSHLIKDLVAIYDHRNTCSRLFEIRGLTRWLVYNEWWKNNPDCNLFVADSDVMIFANLATEMDNWSNYRYTLSMNTAGGQSYWFDRTPMAYTCDTMLSVYRHKNSDIAAKIFGHYDKLQSEGKPGGVCDMTFLKYCAECYGPKVGETTAVINGTTFDHNILMDQGYAYVAGRKLVRWKDGYPFCTTEQDNIPVKFNTLHMSCGGGLVEEYYNNAMEVK